MNQTVDWTLSSRGAKRLIDTKHPWVFSNEIAQRIDVEPGSLVRLTNAHGKVLACGYANPYSLIIFRRLWHGEELESFSALFSKRLAAAWTLRAAAIQRGVSFRWVYGEGDELPGLIIDVYQCEAGHAVVAQILTAGMEKFLATLKEELTLFLAAQSGFESASIVLRRDSRSRLLENLPLLEPLVIGPALSEGRTAYLACSSDQRIGLLCDLESGQKTGLFLDQSENVEQLMRWLPLLYHGKLTLRILDLFCHVGQWGLQIGRYFRDHHQPACIDFCDTSQRALSFASRSATALDLQHSVHELDLIAQLNDLPPQTYDVIICDPPALIKSKKDLASGTRAYQKLFRNALARLSPQGIIVFSSCSHHLSHAEFDEAIAQASARLNHPLQLLYVGGQATDHPVLLHFPQGRYLKCSFFRSRMALP